jgi:hypothetical protein
MFQHHEKRKGIYKFNTDAQALLNNLQSQEIEEINQSMAIKEGNPPPKCTKTDLIKRLEGSLHIFNHIATNLIDSVEPGPPAMRIVL